MEQIEERSAFRTPAIGLGQCCDTSSADLWFQLGRMTITTILRHHRFTARAVLSTIGFGLLCAMDYRLGRRTSLAFSLATALLLACVAVPTRSDPFAVPRQLFFDSVETIVVTSTSVVGEVTIADSILTQFENVIEDKLRAAGLSVVPASEYAEIWDRIAGETGGFFDPYTGERDEESFQTAAGRLRTELVERFDPDAFLYPEIWEVEAPFSVGEAYWAGVTQSVTGGGGYSGDVLATTLLVAIQDTSGNELYTKEAGIQVLEYMLQGEFTRLNSEQLFGDSTFVPAAVSRALDPLLEGRPTIPPES